LAKKSRCWQVKNVEGEIDDETGEPLYWSNDMGWVGKSEADKFRSKKNNPPMGGKWVKCGGK
jgi:hypothetical protein